MAAPIYNLLFKQLQRYFTTRINSVRNVQKRSTEAMSTFSSGECGWRMVGPKEIISHFG